MASEIIGDVGNGVFSHTGGLHFGSLINYPPYVDSIILGNQATGSGTYELSGSGKLSFTEEIIGKAGTGSFIQSGGTNKVSFFYPELYYLILGSETTGSGNYTLSGGSLSAPIEIIGSYGTGVFTQTDGTNTLEPVVYPEIRNLLRLFH